VACVDSVATAFEVRLRFGRFRPAFMPGRSHSPLDQRSTTAMAHDQPELQQRLQRVIDAEIAPGAHEVDRGAKFPRQALDALADAGILGLTVSSELGGGGGGLAEASEVVRQLAQVCGSTAMVVLMHYAATAVIEAHGDERVRRSVAAGRHLSTLAFSEAGSRSHFWAPLGTAVAAGSGGASGQDTGQGSGQDGSGQDGSGQDGSGRDGSGRDSPGRGSGQDASGQFSVRLDADKSWVTSAGEADSYVWSSRPLAADGPMTLWLVPATAEGLSLAGGFDGFGLRANGSLPVRASDVQVGLEAMLGEDGAGLAVAMAEVLPVFLVLSAAFSVG
jgi:alkylation response protein AidB-like acyl-CoA dehydrogenase